LGHVYKSATVGCYDFSHFEVFVCKEASEGYWWASFLKRGPF
jgi:hypothetical protein